MSSAFAFRPAGLSAAVTVGGAAPVTVSLSVLPVGTTVTTSLASGNFIPNGIRIANVGTASLFVQFGPSAGSVSVSTTNGMQMLSNTVESFTNGGLPFMALTCASTFTVTVGYTVGTGL